jgi:hypothetical protein
MPSILEYPVDWFHDTHFQPSNMPQHEQLVSVNAGSGALTFDAFLRLMTDPYGSLAKV